MIHQEAPSQTMAVAGASKIAQTRMTEARFLQLASSELDRAYRLAGLILGDAHEAEDATQDALTRAWRALDSLRDPAGFEAWFDRILVNACRDRLRRRRRIRFVPIGAGRESAEGETEGTHAAGDHAPDPFDAVLRRDQVLRAMDLLGCEERAVVILHYWADLPLSAVAERLGWSAGTVKSRLHRALEKMRDGIAEEPAGKAGWA